MHTHLGYRHFRRVHGGGGGAGFDPKAVYNLRLILKTVL